MKDAHLFMLFLILSLAVKNQSFITSSGIHIDTEYEVNNVENFIYSSLWNYRIRLPFIRLSRKSLLAILILACGDIESCPGPIQYFQNKGISVIHQNIRGLLTNLTNLESFVNTQLNIDILTLSETHITDYNDNKILRTEEISQRRRRAKEKRI